MRTIQGDDELPDVADPGERKAPCGSCQQPFSRATASKAELAALVRFLPPTLCQPAPPLHPRFALLAGMLRTRQ